MVGRRERAEGRDSGGVWSWPSEGGGAGGRGKGTRGNDWCWAGGRSSVPSLCLAAVVAQGPGLKLEAVSVAAADRGRCSSAV